MNAVIKVINPILKYTENNEIIIKSFVDENEVEYTIKEFLDAFAETGRTVEVYCLLFQPMVNFIEQYCTDNGMFYIPDISSKPYYSGNPKHDFFSAVHLTSAKVGATPKTTTVKLKYKDTIYIFQNLGAWFDNLNQFTPTKEEIKEYYKTLIALNDRFRDEYTAKAQNTKHSAIPSGLAAMSRVIIGDIKSFRNKDKQKFLLEIKGAYISGFNFLRDRNTYDKLYYYDISSMYPYLLMNAEFPRAYGKVTKYDGFKRVYTQLAMYHIKELRADVKEGHFPTVFQQKELREKMYIDDEFHVQWYSKNLLYG